MTVPPSVSPKPAATATTVTSRVSTYMSSDDAELGDLCGCERCGADSDSDEIITFMTLTLCRASIREGSDPNSDKADPFLEPMTEEEVREEDAKCVPEGQSQNTSCDGDDEADEAEGKHGKHDASLVKMKEEGDEKTVGVRDMNEVKPAEPLQKKASPVKKQYASQNVGKS